MPARLISMTVKGLTELIRAILIGKQQLPVDMSEANQKVLDEFVKNITTYPSLTPGNMPPPPYWRRGVGLVRGDGRINPVSQKFGQPAISWKTEVGRTATESIGIARTSVTYAPGVVGTETQIPAHRGRWKTVAQVLTNMGLGGFELSSVGAVMTHYNNVRDKFIRSINISAKR
jgi:hypothetical protein